MKNKNTILALSVVLVVVGAYYLVNSRSELQDNVPVSEADKTKESSSQTEQSTLISKNVIQQEESPIVKEPATPELTSLTLFDELFPKDDRAWAWAKVDLEAIKQDIPDNLYWTYAAPTKDESVLEMRKESKAFWEKQHGKVLSNTATEQEIEAFYAHQHAISTDYVEFSTLLINRHRQDLPEQDYAMQTIARNMHLGRLEELPGNLSKALERRKEHESKKQAWQENKEAYEAELAIQREKALRDLGKI